MTRGIWENPDGITRTCPVCEEKFTPTRRNQIFCPAPKRCRYTQRARAFSKNGTMDRRPCTICGNTFTPRRRDQLTCGSKCCGKPDTTRVCANPSCQEEFVIPGNPGKGQGKRKYCTPRCRDQIALWRLTERFRRYDGMTVEEFQKQAAAQDGKCMICGKEPVPDGRSRRDGIYALEVDHDHETGARRDLLCGHCNKGIGHFMDNPDLLRAAAGYIDRHRTQTDSEAPAPSHLRGEPGLRYLPT